MVHSGRFDTTLSGNRCRCTQPGKGYRPFGPVPGSAHPAKTSGQFPSAQAPQVTVPAYGQALIPRLGAVHRHLIPACTVRNRLRLSIRCRSFVCLAGSTAEPHCCAAPAVRWPHFLIRWGSFLVYPQGRTGVRFSRAGTAAAREPTTPCFVRGRLPASPAAVPVPKPRHFLMTHDTVSIWIKKNQSG